MKLDLRFAPQRQRKTALYAVLTAVFGILALFVSDIFVPVCAGVFAALIFCEHQQRICTYVIPAFLLCASVINGWMGLVLCILMLLAGVVIALWFMLGRQKTECAVIVTGSFTVLFLLGLWGVAMEQTGSMSPAVAMEYYQQLLVDLKDTFIREFSSAVVVEEESAEMVAAMLALIENMFAMMFGIAPALIVLLAFFFAGVACKVFTRCVLSASLEPRYILSWSFRTGNLYAYFYLALFVANLFFAGGTDTVSLVIMNLYYIFLGVYAYIGARFGLFWATQTRRRGMILTIGILLLVTSPVFAAQVLSCVGVFFTIIFNKGNRLFDNGPK